MTGHVKPAEVGLGWRIALFGRFVVPECGTLVVGIDDQSIDKIITEI